MRQEEVQDADIPQSDERPQQPVASIQINKISKYLSDNEIQYTAIRKDVLATRVRLLNEQRNCEHLRNVSFTARSKFMKLMRHARHYNPSSSIDVDLEMASEVVERADADLRG